MDPLHLPLNNDLLLAYARAVYAAQRLERALYLLVYIKNNNEPGLDQITNIFEVRESKTLRALLDSLPPDIRSDGELYSRLKNAKDRRNFLVHQYFFAKIDELSTPDGQEREIKKIQRDCIDLFESLDSQIMQMVVRWAEQKKNVNPDFLRKLWESGVNRDYFSSDLKWIVEHRVFIVAPVSRVWGLLTDSSFSHDIGGLYISDWRADSEIMFKAHNGSIVMQGVIHQVESPRILHFSRYYKDAAGGYSRQVYSGIRYELVPLEFGTVLHIHEQFTYPLYGTNYEEVLSGWQNTLGHFKKVLER
jgi:hypothetical protein